MPQLTKRETLIDTPWVKFSVKTFDAEPHTYYVVEPHPYTAIIAFTREGDLILVEQFRPAVEEIVLEMPAGTVEAGEDPADCALRELLEETGYRATSIESLGWMYPDAGRLTNKIWGFVIRDAVLDPTYTPEAGIVTRLISPADFNEMMARGEFKQALHAAFWGMWLARRGL